MAPYCRIAPLMGTPGGDEATTAYNANLTIHNMMMLTPMWLGPAGRPRARAAIVDRNLIRFAKGTLAVHVAEVFPRAAIADAHRQSERGGVIGKLVAAIA